MILGQDAQTEPRFDLQPDVSGSCARPQTPTPALRFLTPPAGSAQRFERKFLHFAHHEGERILERHVAPEKSSEAKNQALTREVIGEEVGRHINVSQKEIEEYYNAHKADFVREEKVFLSEILISIQGKDTAGIAAAEKKADLISDEASKGQRFSDLARDNSDANTAKDGGQLGGYKKGDLNKDIESAVWNLPRGAVTKPVKIATGFEVFKVDDHTKAGLAPIEDVKGEIESVLYGPKMQPKVREYLTQLRRESFLQIKPGFVDTGAASGQDTKWQDPAVLKPETVTKAEVEEKTRRKRLFGMIPIPGTTTTVEGKSSSR